MLTSFHAKLKASCTQVLLPENLLAQHQRSQPLILSMPQRRVLNLMDKLQHFSFDQSVSTIENNAAALFANGERLGYSHILRCHCHRSALTKSVERRVSVDSIAQAENVPIRISFGNGLIDIPLGNILQSSEPCFPSEEMSCHTLIFIGMVSSPTNSPNRFMYSSLLGRIRKSSNPGSGSIMNMNSCPGHIDTMSACS